MSKKVTEVVAELVLPILEPLKLELVEVEFKKEGPNWFLRVYIDSEKGVDLEDCSEVSEKLSEQLDQVDPIEQAYFLEVSSPGAERPLKNEKELENAVGKYIHVSTYEALDGEKSFEGDLLSFNDGVLTVEVMKKTRKKQLDIPYEKVAKARLAIKL
ncbi:hypothetical protein BTS2_0567 [Bacillus sp. TS-2]|nr:hypothetical protein BTS2_0567 [Bacillus sp. TS-2]